MGSTRHKPISRVLFQALLLVMAFSAVIGSRVNADTAPQRLRVVGNHVITDSGQVFIPEGISVYGGLEASAYNRYQDATYAQIQAAAQYWHANTIRFQVAESNMFAHPSANKTYDAQFLNAMNQQVAYAHSLGMAVVINDQTEFTNKTELPTAQTVQFWHILANAYRSQPYVIFDLFNEPRLTDYPYTSQLTAGIDYNPIVESQLETYHTAHKKISRGQVWNLWRSGGVFQGTTYVGMQTLVDTVRSEHAQNLIWAEGSYGARQLPPDHYLLHGSNIEYSIHHPNLNNEKSWKPIAKLAAKQPVVDGEWAQYESTWPECYSSAFQNAPKYINFLQAHGVGIIAWSLQPNSLLDGGDRYGQPTNLETARSSRLASALATPNKIRSDYACDDYGQGVGNLLQRYFAQNSTHYDL